jgi:transketolase
MEGISQEAISLAGHLKLNKLIVFWDDNNISIDGPVSMSDSTDQHARFRAANWNTIAVDGHDPEAIAAAIEGAQKSDKPTLIACKTVIGFGAPNKAGTHKVHGSPLGAEEIAAPARRSELASEAFVVPRRARRLAPAAGPRCRGPQGLVRSASTGIRQEGRVRPPLRRRPAGGLGRPSPPTRRSSPTKPTVATRKASEDALEVINGVCPRPSAARPT